MTKIKDRQITSLSMILGHQRLQQTITNSFAPSITLFESSPKGNKGHHDPRTVSDANENITYKLTHVTPFSKLITIIPTHLVM